MASQHGVKQQSGDLQHSFGTTDETWQGTKQQLQHQGLGTGMPFPGEAGAPERLSCRCPLGFEVIVYRFDSDPEGVYRASSEYLPEPAHEPPYEPYAPGVMRRRGFWSWDYIGTADALAAAGVARLDQFPGQPGRPKGQASYRSDGAASGASPHPNTSLRIRRMGKGRFEISVDLDKRERDERNAEREAARQAHLQACEQAREERMRLREIAAQITDDPAEGFDKFRNERAEHLEFLFRMIWQLLTKQDGAFSMAIPEGGEQYDQVAGAFDMLREVVQTATIVEDGKAMALVRNRQELAAARSDRGFQRFLGSARQLHLVHSVR